MKKNVCFTTQWYNTNSDRFRKTFVSTIVAEIYGMQGQKWNAKRMIIFHMVILQHIWLVTGTKNICTQIYARLKLWNKSAFGELVCDSYAATKEYLGRDRGNQSAEHYHCVFFILVIQRKFHKAIIFFCDWYSGGVLLPNDITSDKTVVTEETVMTMLEENICTKNSPQFYARGVWQNAYFYFCGY